MYYFLSGMALYPVMAISEYNYLKKSKSAYTVALSASMFLDISSITGFNQSKSAYST